MTTQTLQTDSEKILKDYHSDLVAFLDAHFKAASQDDSIPVDTVGFSMTRIRVLLDTCISELNSNGEKRFGDPDLGDQIKDAVAKATGWTLGNLSGMGSHGSAKMLRDQYMFLNGVSLGYTMLYTTEVGSHGEGAYATMLLEHLQEWNKLIVDFNRALPGLVLETLAGEDEGFSKDRAVEITKKLQATWSGSAG